MKRQIVQLLGVIALLAVSLFYVNAQTRGSKTSKPQPKPRANGCCTATTSGGLIDCNKPHYPSGGGATCPNKVKAKCDKNYSNCTKEDW